jgi:hypothetical protein
MKRIKQLILRSEVIRQLSGKELSLAAGGEIDTWTNQATGTTCGSGCSTVGIGICDCPPPP